MSEDSSNKTNRASDGLSLKTKQGFAADAIKWSPWLAILFVVGIYYVSQYGSAILISAYPILRDWTSSETRDWLTNSIYAQFFYVLFAEAFVVGAVYLFLKRFKATFKTIGFRRFKWSDLVYALMAAPLYYALYIVVATIATRFMPSLNVDQPQQIGFEDAAGLAALSLTFVSLVVLPPLAEEILVRGFLYSSLKKGMSVLIAALVTSLVFAVAHLQFGTGEPLLWIAAIDTFVLSLVLIYLREKTGSLWSSIILHGLKNGIAFISLFILHVR